MMVAIQKKRKYVVDLLVVKERREKWKTEVEVELRGCCRGGYNKHTQPWWFL